MAQLIVRGLEDDIKLRLRARAARHGHSMKAEARDILRDALTTESHPSQGLGSRIAARFADIGFALGEVLEQPDWDEPRDPFATSSAYDRLGHHGDLGADDGTERRGGCRLARCPAGDVGLDHCHLGVGDPFRHRTTGRRRDALAGAFADILESELDGRVLGFTMAEAIETAALMARQRAGGRTSSTNDDMMAGIVRVRRATLATRNLSHFDQAGIALVTPWRPDPMAP